MEAARTRRATPARFDQLGRGSAFGTSPASVATGTCALLSSSTGTATAALGRLTRCLPFASTASARSRFAGAGTAGRCRGRMEQHRGHEPDGCLHEDVIPQADKHLVFHHRSAFFLTATLGAYRPNRPRDLTRMWRRLLDTRSGARLSSRAVLRVKVSFDKSVEDSSFDASNSTG